MSFHFRSVLYWSLGIDFLQIPFRVLSTWPRHTVNWFLSPGTFYLVATLFCPASTPLVLCTSYFSFFFPIPRFASVILCFFLRAFAAHCALPHSHLSVFAFDSLGWSDAILRHPFRRQTAQRRIKQKAPKLGCASEVVLLEKLTKICLCLMTSRMI